MIDTRLSAGSQVAIVQPAGRLPFGIGPAALWLFAAGLLWYFIFLYSTVCHEAAHAWTHERKRVVIMHEMAHIARRDSATQLVATLACVAYWIPPLVILAARRLRAECERACDERVLERNGRGATHLVGARVGPIPQIVVRRPALVGLGLASCLGMPTLNPQLLITFWALVFLSCFSADETLGVRVFRYSVFRCWSVF